MKIPFSKAHGAKNDFLLTWEHEAPETGRVEMAKAICDRHTGIGADGWMLVGKPTDGDAEGSIQLYNSDGSTAEISGNGTRCAAAFLIRHGFAASVVRIRTGAGIKTLRLLKRTNLSFEFEMNMGRPEVLAERFQLPLSGGARDVTLLYVGNPQCAMPVDNFDFDWRTMGAEIESHAHFPKRTNVSFVKAVDAHTIDVRFYERGAGETMSSGTGSTGAAYTAVLRGMAQSPVRVLTPAGPIDLRLEDEIFLTGPAEIIADGQFLAE
ncbi:MAG TPA: diaminopimelate epimerase [Candidatus Sulfopaludibacter sp.]|jgi:diaminopimelate epimerase|nr:diaminopimelate epimerase [Candidatus Sulfopaludibacter sp.]